MRVILIVLDSVGIGELPDAGRYGDEGSNTLCNIKRAVKSMELPHLNRMGLCHISGGEILGDTSQMPEGAFGKLAEASQGKDTTTGHWEIAGLRIDKAFPVFPNGFPPDLIHQFEKGTGRGTIGNKAASGTAIIEELGEEHIKTGKLIVYTSADSVFQIAAHEEVAPLEELYRICQTARHMLQGDWMVSRVIARPFTGVKGAFARTANRRDFSVEPLGKTMLDYIQEEGLPVAAVGKIEDIFSGVGITEAVHTKNNREGVDGTLDYMDKIRKGLIFTNLVDFDMLYGHRNDAAGYARALMEFDQRLPEIVAKMRDGDLLMITADHGCDPTTPSTDHSREYVPLLAYGSMVKAGASIGVRASFADIAATVLAYLGVKGNVKGESFLSLIKNEGRCLH